MKKKYIIGGLVLAAVIGGYFMWQSYEASHKMSYTGQVFRDRQPCC